MMIALEGADMCGKTQIAKELCRRTGYPYHKNMDEWSSDLRTPDYFKNTLIYGSRLFNNLLYQVRPNVVLDRYYPSEWVYSSVFKRDTDESIVRSIDDRFAEAGGMIVLCRRKSFAGLQDDLHNFIDAEVLEKIDRKYGEFAHWTSCKVKTVWVDDQDLDREVKEIISFMEE